MGSHALSVKTVRSGVCGLVADDLQQERGGSIEQEVSDANLTAGR
jgi:hypothetical protein